MPNSLYKEWESFKRKVPGHDKITDWSLEGVSPTLVSEDRKLAYHYYSDVPGMVWIEKLMFCDETEITNLVIIYILFLGVLVSTGLINNQERLVEIRHYESEDSRPFTYKVIGFIILVVTVLILVTPNSLYQRFSG